MGCDVDSFSQLNQHDLCSCANTPLTSYHWESVLDINSTQRGSDLEPMSLSRRFSQETVNSTLVTHWAAMSVCQQAAETGSQADIDYWCGIGEKRLIKSGHTVLSVETR